MADGAGKKLKLRTIAICCFMVLLLSWVLYNLVYRSLVTGEELKARAAEQQLQDVSITANRGTIYDSNMNVLAQSATVWDVILSPKDFYAAKNELKGENGEAATQAEKDAYERTMIEGLAEILDVETSSIEEHLTHTESMYREISRKVVKSVADEVTAFVAENDIAGVYLQVNTKRFYPYDDLASSVIGFTNYDNQGVYGLEAEYDEVLSGTPGRQISAKNAVGETMPTTYEQYYPAQDGNSLVLTIDQVIQHYLEKTLDATIAQHKPAEGAAGIVMDVNTGAILAMASMPNYDLNEPYIITDEAAAAAIDAMEDGEVKTEALAAAREKQWKNKTVTDIYEPGSVFKVVTASAALEEGAATVNSTYNCTGSVMVDGWPYPIHCHDHAGHGLQNFTEAVVNSCNPAFISIGQALGSGRFFRYFDAFGLTERTGIDLPAEAQNSYYTEERLNAVSLASCSFGQSNTVTPIQMITAASAAVNGGKLLTPHVVSKILDSDGNTVEEFGTEVRRQVISEETSETMCGILEQVVSANGGTNAYVKGYRIGGKSGTSELLNMDRRADGDYKKAASFVAVLPADDPQILVYVMLDDPNNANSDYSSVLAAPVVGNIISEIAPYLGVATDGVDRSGQTVKVPNLIGTEWSNAQVNLNIRGLAHHLVESESGNTAAPVTWQYPTAGAEVPSGTTIYLYTDTYSGQTAEVPDLTGKSADFASQMLHAAGFNCIVEGSAAGLVQSQSAAPGDRVQLGTIVTITCG